MTGPPDLGAHSVSIAKASIRVILETNFLFKHPFDDPQFQRLLQLSKEKQIELFASHIVWEERRTQIVDHICQNLDRARDAIAKAESGSLTFVTDGLPLHPGLWDRTDIERRSREGMNAIAVQYNIGILPASPEHGTRAWQRYFAGEAPFRSVKFRGDIPDSWILEAAIDLAAEGGNLYALCGELKDRLLGDALGKAGYIVIEGLQELLDRIEIDLAGAETKPIEAPPQSAASKPQEIAFQDVEEQVLGFATYFRGPGKERLFELLASAGVPREQAEGAASRLVVQGRLTDTGNHFLPIDGPAADAAAQKVQPLVIGLLADDGS